MSSKQVAILHYAVPPGVGGVESTIAYHARELARLGYAVRVIGGSGEPFEPNVTVMVDPLFGSSDRRILAAKAELDKGRLPPTDWAELVAEVKNGLSQALNGCPVCIAHNVTSLHKNLPLTAALAELQEEGKVQIIAWCHDLAWTNSQYQPELHDGYPWNLLRQTWPGTRYVTVSEPRRIELAELLSIPPESIEVVVPGVDPARFFHWTPVTQELAEKLKLLDADGLLLTPARLTRRKNIGLALKILAEMRYQSGRDFRLIVTGPPGPHNPANPGYLGELLDLCHTLHLEEAAHFLYAFGDHSAPDHPLIPDDDTLANLYQLADALLFPSTQEGFGIPILEAGLAKLPIFCADIPPLKATAQADAIYFDPVNEPPTHIAERILTTLAKDSAHRLNHRVRTTFRWERLVREQIVPLIEEQEKVHDRPTTRTTSVPGIVNPL